MTLDMDLTSLPNTPQFRAAFENQAEMIEVELAETSLRGGLFGVLGTSHLARTVAWEMVSMLQLSLQAGNLSQFRRQVEWEIGVAYHHHQLFKRDSDLALVGLLETVMLKCLASELAGETKAVLVQVRAMFEDCWHTAQQRWWAEERSN